VSEVGVTISEVIRQVRKEYIDSGLAESFYKINSGLCEDFGLEVQSKLKGIQSVSEFYTECLQTEDGGWDWKCLRNKHQCGAPSGLSEAEVDNIRFGGHMFLKYQGKWYDAECPDGADSPFDLPIFRRPVIAALRIKGIATEDVITDDVVPAPRCQVNNPVRRHPEDDSALSL
jgi:hypothetical protein